MISSNNVFRLKNPSAYKCRVSGYVMGHSQLFVRASIHPSEISTADVVCLAFEDVLYYEGPMWWLGADFRSGTRDEHLKIIELLHRTQHENIERNDEHVLNKYHLFILERPDTQVRIVAAMVFKATQCPEIQTESTGSSFEAIDITPPSATP